ncbi:class IV adenylate cyclase [Streptomyces sp. NPDC056987]|uniref:class IV adenylate cyclase n=1 Tax=Streptomyces sp. NPDC056987 TaxID=3345988 RepID=UPI00362C79BF
MGLSEPVRQDDQAYAPSGWTPGDGKRGVSFVRLRTVEGRRTFTLKPPDLNEQSCTERETVVADRAQTHEAIMLMGYAPTVRVAKHRRTGVLGGAELCVDDLDGVGTFLELERIVSEEADEASVQAELAAMVTDLGIACERTTETYDALVRRG